MVGICGLALISMCFPGPGSAQEGTALITGTAVDPMGAVIPGVSVDLALARSPGSAYHGSTDGNGVYGFSGLAAGEYTMTLSIMGFSRLRLEGIRISDGQHMTMPVELGLAQSACSESLALDHARILEGVGETGDLAGRVTLDQDQVEGHGPPLAGADVRLFCGKKATCALAKTNAMGEFEFLSLKPGRFSVLVKRRGFYPAGPFEAEVQKGRRVVFEPVELERCPGGNCDPKLRPDKPIFICE
jgi:hypothetical protein